AAAASAIDILFQAIIAKVAPRNSVDHCSSKPATSTTTMGAGGADDCDDCAGDGDDDNVAIPAPEPSVIIGSSSQETVVDDAAGVVDASADTDSAVPPDFARFRLPVVV